MEALVFPSKPVDMGPETPAIKAFLVHEALMAALPVIERRMAALRDMPYGRCIHGRPRNSWTSNSSISADPTIEAVPSKKPTGTISIQRLTAPPRAATPTRRALP